MNKQEIKNILNKDWTQRRLRQKLRNEKNSALVKAWKLREALLGDSEGQEQVEIKREAHYLDSSSRLEKTPKLEKTSSKKTKN